MFSQLATADARNPESTLFFNLLPCELTVSHMLTNLCFVSLMLKLMLNLWKCACIVVTACYLSIPMHRHGFVKTHTTYVSAIVSLFLIKFFILGGHHVCKKMYAPKSLEQLVFEIVHFVADSGFLGSATEIMTDSGHRKPMSGLRVAWTNLIANSEPTQTLGLLGSFWVCLGISVHACTSGQNELDSVKYAESVILCSEHGKLENCTLR